MARHHTEVSKTRSSKFGAAYLCRPRASSGRWVHVAKVAFEKYFLHKVRAGTTEPYYEKMVMRLLDIGKAPTQS